jgi:hypothetical protein
VQLLGARVPPGLGTRLAAQRAAGLSAGQMQALAGAALSSGSGAGDVSTGDVLSLPMISAPSQITYLGSFSHLGNRVGYAGSGQFLSIDQNAGGDAAQLRVCNIPAIGGSATVVQGPVTLNQNFFSGTPEGRQLSGAIRLGGRIYYQSKAEYDPAFTQVSFVSSIDATTLSGQTTPQAASGLPALVGAQRAWMGSMFLVPAEYRGLFNGHDLGVVNNLASIISNDQGGPGTCMFSSSAVDGSGTVPMLPLMAFGQDEALADAYFWKNHNNGSISFGEFVGVASAGIVPGTRTLLLAGYQDRQTNPNYIGGGFNPIGKILEFHCIDLAHLVDVKNGTRQIHTVRPTTSYTAPGSYGWDWRGWERAELGTGWEGAFYCRNTGFFDPSTLRMYVNSGTTCHVFQVSV